jgi:hypothetical protein
MSITHGTYAAYKVHHCRCEPCRKASSLYTTRRKRQIAYGRWEPYVDATPAREHVQRLRAAGIGWKRVAELAGLSASTVDKLVYGAPERGMGPSKRIRHATAEKILAVQPGLENLGDKALVDGTGTRRRLQALVASGWSQSKLAVQLGMTPANFGPLLKRTRLHADTVRAVHALYERLWDCPPPESEWRDKIAASRSRTYAAERGWARPMAWDENIDDPTASPEGVGSAKSRGKLPPAEDIAWLVQGGDSVEVIADRYGTTVDGVKARLARAEESVA